MELSIQERLKDLRVERGLTLEPVSYTHLDNGNQQIVSVCIGSNGLCKVFVKVQFTRDYTCLLYTSSIRA